MIQFIKNWLLKWKEPDIKGQSVDEVEEEEILKNQDDYFVDLLKHYARQDKERYFQAGNERTRLIIRGEYLRTLFLIKKIRKVKVPKVVGEETKIGSRYGV